MCVRNTVAWLSLVGACALGCVVESRPAPDRDLVVLVVLDTIRADHLSLCGHSRPTSPALEAIAAAGASVRCDAQAPGTWTLPSHASYFTGLPVVEHGAHFGPGGRRMLWDVTVFPLDARAPTLAEQMAAAGYRTAAVSANPVVSSETGLTRGFEIVRRAGSFGELYGERLERALEQTLDQVAEDEPLFLFLNVADAHHPWPAIPQGLDWVPERAGMTYGIKQPDSPWRRYMAGEMAEEEAAELREHSTDLYDWGVRRADRTLAGALEVLRRRGRLAGDHRIVITSDHGEFLGEHGLTGHCCYPYEAVTRVPLLVLDSSGSPQLPGPVSALHAFHLARDGALPPVPAPLVSVGFPSPNMIEHVGRLGHELAVASWSGTRKSLWIEDRRLAFDLETDPDELRPLPAGGPDALLDSLAAAARASHTRGAAARADAAAVEHLEALGYVE